MDGKETAAFPVGFADWQKEMTLSTADLHLDIRRKCRLQITVCEAIDASDKFAVGRCAMAKPFEMDFGMLDFPIINQDLGGHVLGGLERRLPMINRKLHTKSHTP